HPKAVLRPESVRISVQKGPIPTPKLLPVVVQAWHEAYGQPIPSPGELSERLKAVRAAKKASDGGTLALLSTGPKGVGAFNERPMEERSKAVLKKANLAGRHLNGIAFGGADLGGADLSGASLARASFWDSGLSSSLKGAKLVGAKMARANLAGCRCPDADF